MTNIRALIIDMDGVLWHGNTPLPGLKEFFTTLRALRLSFILATNNASATPESYVAKLKRMGVEVGPEEILTSGIATACYLAERYDPKTTRVYAIGEEGLLGPLREAGFTLTKSHKETRDFRADVVVVGKDETLTWDKLATATLNLNLGAAFVGTNADTTFPTEFGITHGNGAILAALTCATGIEPLIVGKPEPIMYQQALSRLKLEPQQVVAVGDRLETDILGAVRAGIPSLLVLSGISRAEDLAAVDYRPDWILPDIRALTKVLRETRESS
nr:HAD family hydrolase [uncultured Gammaproteobacteria bacterium]